MMKVSDEVITTNAFKIEEIKNSLGEYISKINKKQLRIAETEKYAHVTFFFNGGIEEEYEGEVMASCHGRRKGDTEMQTYYIINDDGDKVLAVDKDGKPLLKNGITYNPKLKTKLMGVLTGCLLKAKDPTYSKIYYDLRMRYDNSPYYKDTSDAHKNMMAQRYMVKEFLRAMWITWRRLEGLEVDEPYEVAKLGNRPHKYNEYQCKVAEETKNSKAV